MFKNYPKVIGKNRSDSSMQKGIQYKRKISPLRKA
jgi:hypothetical protein